MKKTINSKHNKESRYLFRYLMKARFVDEVTRLHRPYYAPVVVGVSAAAICIMLSVCSQDTASDGSIE